MLTVDEALAEILTQVVRSPATEDVPLSEALGRILAQAVDSDVDSPPFDKALMDGFAVRAVDFSDGRAELRVVEEVMAGQVPQQHLSSGCATRIMTGAPIPEGADAVVRIEDTQTTGDKIGGIVTVAGAPVVAGQNIMNRGTSTRVGDRVVTAGTLLRPQEIGALAEAGQERVAVSPRPRVGILATGDELVPIGAKPAAGQIRNSNEAMLAAQMLSAGAAVESLGIARDNRNHLRERVDAGLCCDVLLLSGGVSAGDLDLVPSVLEEAGVRKVFHKVQIKPGKPLWFGVSQNDSTDTSKSGQRCYVFGLPGNPVSSMVCTQLFVKAAINRLLGKQPERPCTVPARLAHDHTQRGNRPTFHPACCQDGPEGRSVQTVPWQGSSDLRATTAANCLAYFPAGDQTYPAGSAVKVYDL